jgi:hypothetical protein
LVKWRRSDTLPWHVTALFNAPVGYVLALMCMTLKSDLFSGGILYLQAG